MFWLHTLQGRSFVVLRSFFGITVDAIWPLRAINFINNAATVNYIDFRGTIVLVDVYKSYSGPHTAACNASYFITGYKCEWNLTTQSAHVG